MNPSVPCKACKGTGRTSLTASLLNTYRVIKILGTPTIPELFKALGEDRHKTSTHKRVNRLVKLKLVRKIAGIGVQRFEAVK